MISLDKAACCPPKRQTLFPGPLFCAHFGPSFAPFLALDESYGVTIGPDPDAPATRTRLLADRAGNAPRTFASAVLAPKSSALSPGQTDFSLHLAFQLATLTPDLHYTVGLLAYSNSDLLLYNAPGGTWHLEYRANGAEFSDFDLGLPVDLAPHDFIITFRRGPKTIEVAIDGGAPLVFPFTEIPFPSTMWTPFISAEAINSSVVPADLRMDEYCLEAVA